MIAKLTSIEAIESHTWYEFTVQTQRGLLSIMLYYDDENYMAYENNCPHQGRRLDYAAGKFLITPNQTIVCPAHAAEFNPTNGLCINGPCLGESLKPIIIKCNDHEVFAVVE